MEKFNIACIGCGNMGGAIVRGLCTIMDPKSIYVSAAHFESAQKFALETGVNACSTNDEAAQEANIIFLAVKPAYIKQVLAEISDSILQNTIIVSMAAGVTLDQLNQYCGGETSQIFRIMPNMPAQIGSGMTALCAMEGADSKNLETVKTLLESTGRVEVVGEKLMNCVTGISGSGPAFVFMFIEALADAAVLNGMPRPQAYTYAAQTVYGSAQMVLETGKAPAVLKDAVCSPGGTTIAGVAALEQDGFRNATIHAVTAATKRSEELSK